MAHSSLTVQAQAYEALSKLAGTGTTFFLGDWSRAPQQLLNRSSFFPTTFAPLTLAPSGLVATQIQPDPRAAQKP